MTFSAQRQHTRCTDTKILCDMTLCERLRQEEGLSYSVGVTGVIHTAIKVYLLTCCTLTEVFYFWPGEQSRVPVKSACFVQPGLVRTVLKQGCERLLLGDAAWRREEAQHGWQAQASVWAAANPRQVFSSFNVLTNPWA